jgi:hypothetical protein
MSRQGRSLTFAARARYIRTRAANVSERPTACLYVEARGMGMRRHIVEGMRRHNGTEPHLIEEESRFIVRLWKEPRHA